MATYARTLHLTQLKRSLETYHGANEGVAGKQTRLHTSRREKGEESGGDDAFQGGPWWQYGSDDNT